MAESSDLNQKRLLSFVENLQADGRYTFTRADLIENGERSAVALEAALRRLKRKGKITSPRREFYVLVPVEYREAGCPPASWFIDDLMRFLAQPYYVGLLSAAAIHGAAHQQPMVFQVVTDRPTRPAAAGRVRIVFHMRRNVAAARVIDVQTETGSMRVSSPAATAFDLVRFVSAAAHLSNVATVLAELAEKIDAKGLVDIADSCAAPEVQRLGYLLEQVDKQELASALWERLRERRYRPVMLAPGEGKVSAPADPRWRVIPNAAVEVDV